jgi:UDP-N-acetylmuramate dehydrogenase
MNSVYSVLRTFGQVKANELMSRHTTFKIGGPVDYFCSINKTENVIKALHYLDGEGIPYFLVGSGSNMLVRDEGFRGVERSGFCR